MQIDLPSTCGWPDCGCSAAINCFVEAFNSGRKDDVADIVVTDSESRLPRRGRSSLNDGPVEGAQHAAGNEWGGIETLLQQRNDALAEVERLRRGSK